MAVSFALISHRLSDCVRAEIHFGQNVVDDDEYADDLQIDEKKKISFFVEMEAEEMVISSKQKQKKKRGPNEMAKQTGMGKCVLCLRGV